MGNSSRKLESLQYQFKKLLKGHETAVKSKTLEGFLKSIERVSPWFITGGSLNITDWEEVRRDLHRLLQKEGSESLPPTTFSLWRLVRGALLTDKVHHHQVVQDTNEAFLELQETETQASLSSGAESDDEPSEETLTETRGSIVSEDEEKSLSNNNKKKNG